MTDNRKKILVIRGQADSSLDDVLSDLSYREIPCTYGPKALDHVAKDDIAAIFIDTRELKKNLMRFVLDARAIENRIPVIIKGGPKDIDELMVLNNMAGVYLLGENISRTRLEIEIKRILQDTTGNDMPAASDID
jgi:DNA-binding NtrC family response regulator